MAESSRAAFRHRPKTRVPMARRSLRVPEHWRVVDFSGPGHAGRSLPAPGTRQMELLRLILDIKGLRPQNLVGAAFGCYGWSGESPKMMTDALTEMKVEVVAEPVKSYFNPGEEDLANARALGVAVARALKEKCAQ